MRFIPSEDEQIWLIQNLANLCTAMNINSMLECPIIEANSTFFPDKMANDTTFAEIILRRLMGYANLSALKYNLTIDNRTDQTESDDPAAWFCGIEDGIACFGLNCRAMISEFQIVSSLAHEVTHAYRHYYQLTVEDQHEEELLTDLTMVFLGFGLIFLQGAIGYESKVDVIGQMSIHSVKSNRLGYLDQQSVAFLLTIQLMLKKYSVEEIAKLVATCDSNCKEFVNESISLIKEKYSNLCDNFNIGDNKISPKDDIHSFILPEKNEVVVVNDEAKNIAVVETHTRVGISIITWLIVTLVSVIMLFKCNFTTASVFYILISIVSLKYTTSLKKYICSECGTTIKILPVEKCPKCKREIISSQKATS